MSESDINAQWREQPASQAPAESDASADESTSELPTSELPSYPPDEPGSVERSADATGRAHDPQNSNQVAASGAQDPSMPNDGATPVPGAPVLAAAAPGVPPQPSAPHFPMNYAPYPQPGPDGQVASPAQAGPPAQPAPPEAGQPPIWQPQWYAPGAPPQQPPFGPAGPGQPGPFGQPSQPHRAPRIGRWLGAGVLAILLAGGGGVAGGAIVHAADSNKSGTSASSTSSTTRGSSAPVLDRSSLASIVAGVKDSVVSIFTQTGEGSGVVLDTNGYILTNNHVVADAQGDTVQVTFANGNSVKAKVVGTDARTDLAVVKASGASDLSPAKFGDSNALEVGDSVIAIGSPLGLDGSVTSGIVSALNRTIDESSSGDQNQNPFSQQQQQQQSSTSIAGAIQTDAAINPGNSGGALVNMAGEVIGINTAILTGDSSSSGNIGVGFAIPSNRAKEVAQALINGQKVSHPYIGVSVATDTGNAGARVASVVDGSPASKGGVQQGDVITRAGDADIHTSDDLLNVVQAAKIGDQLKLTVQRGGAEKTLTVTIGESPN